MSWTPPTVAAFKTQFIRDFPYAPSLDPNNLDYVTDTDVQNAINEAQAFVNDDSVYGANTTMIFMYLAAHTLVVTLRDSTQGLSSQAKFALESSSVGGVSLSNSIPEAFKTDPLFSGFLTTGYGKKFLNMAYPYTIGGGAGYVEGYTSSA